MKTSEQRSDATFSHHRSRTMNPSASTQPVQLFGASMHAGGWPKLGWQLADGADEAAMSEDEDQAQEG
jgi:hypothetical protein